MSHNVPQVVLVDGSAYLYRAYSVSKDPSKVRRSTSLQSLVVAMLGRVKRECGNCPTVVVFDGRGPTFRNFMSSAYKANRPKMDSELSELIPAIHQCIVDNGFPVICISGVEADDVIGTLTRRITALGARVTIASSDKDFVQLIGKDVRMINTRLKPSEITDAASATARYRVTPEHFVDFLALTGDAIDEIKGIDGIGPGTAVGLIRQYNGGLDAIYADLDSINEKIPHLKPQYVKELLLSNRESVMADRELCRIRTDLECVPDLNEIDATSPYYKMLTKGEIEQLAALFKYHD